MNSSFYNIFLNKQFYCFSLSLFKFFGGEPIQKNRHGTSFRVLWRFLWIMQGHEHYTGILSIC